MPQHFVNVRQLTGFCRCLLKKRCGQTICTGRNPEAASWCRISRTSGSAARVKLRRKIRHRKRWPGGATLPSACSTFAYRLLW